MKPCSDKLRGTVFILKCCGLQGLSLFKSPAVCTHGPNLKMRGKATNRQIKNKKTKYMSFLHSQYNLGDILEADQSLSKDLQCVSGIYFTTN